MKVFEPVVLGREKLQNRIIRSATYEGMADEKGVPMQSYVDYYESLAKQQIGGIITIAKRPFKPIYEDMRKDFYPPGTCWLCEANSKRIAEIYEEHELKTLPLLQSFRRKSLTSGTGERRRNYTGK
ncbi:NADH:flavin oxidoreductase / NADH oxidase family protein [Peptoclostridium litorale DSM 5388]|uniref:Uncharacterized protein n=1 Tax=Peptoclostridium litorale DSM 5388 TaxID=1121324 RepID=A0A069RH97_PEPLI|nr:hypothetical protein [Peptoclostridium litorale]KDR96419.1 hypothetical protein CLIT_2c00250 [Peptoclostridium litorale DSM 5388]SIN70809.1 NADH:flavin oxidoreductase / NADH oxidase family protein [Peptoclostridium litorale DSM 5388]